MFDDTKFTNLWGDAEVSGSSPDADQDWFYITQYLQDTNYWHEKILDSMKALSNDPDKDYFIIYGGEVTDGGSGTVDIAEGVAVGKDSDDKPRLFKMPSLTGVSIPSGWNDGRTIYVQGLHDFKLDTSATRNHYDTTVYHHIVNDSYLGDTNSLTTTSTDDLFTTTNPKATAATESSICWGSFTMTGTTFAALTTRSRIYATKVGGHVTVSDQFSFDNIFTRTGAGAYDIKDEITSLYFVKGDYSVEDMFDFLSSGSDTYAIIDTNNCNEIICENETNLTIGDTIFTFTITTDNFYCKNLTVQGTGSVAVSSANTFSISADGSKLENCSVKDRHITTSHNAFSGGSMPNKETMSLVNCSVHNIETNTGGLKGFSDCRNLINCKVFDITTSNYAYAFSSCNRITNCTANGVSIASGSGGAYGFLNCDQITNCYANEIDSSSGVATGFHSCEFMTSCKSDDVDGGTAAYGFQVCNYITTSVADNITATAGNAYGFYDCETLSSCFVDNITASGVANGFNSCIRGSSLYTTETANASNNYIDTADAQVTSQNSCGNYWT